MEITEDRVSEHQYRPIGFLSHVKNIKKKKRKLRESMATRSAIKERVQKFFRLKKIISEGKRKLQE